MSLKSFNAKFLFVSIVCIGLFTSCGSDPAAENSENEDETTEEIAAEAVSQEEIQEVHAARLEEQKNDLDSIQYLVETWNQSLNENDPELMLLVYGSQVQYYKKSLKRQEVINAKKSALAKSPDYKQSVVNLGVHYPSDRPNVIRCEFDKAWSSGGKSDTVRALLEIELVNKQYRIVKEGDYATEIAMIKEAKTKALSKGQHTYLYDYWLDTREEEVLAHDFVPYYLSVTVDNSGENPRVDVNWYSGAFRQSFDFVTRNVRLDGQYLRFEGAAIMMPGDEEDLSDYQSFAFKLLGEEIALIENNGWFSEMLGIRLWRVKDE